MPDRTITIKLSDLELILDALLIGLVFVTDCEHSTDFKPGSVAKNIATIRERADFCGDILGE